MSFLCEIIQDSEFKGGESCTGQVESKLKIPENFYC